MRVGVAIVLCAVGLMGCAARATEPPAPPPATAPPAAGPPASTDNRELDQIATIHGGAGPWVVAGYRMGEYALKELGLSRFSFDLEVEHRTPHKVQFSCIADGAAAATGASVGKLNLTLVDADDAHVATTYRRKSTGREITLRTTAAFAARFLDVPRDKLGDAGRTVLSLKDDAIFEVVSHH